MVAVHIHCILDRRDSLPFGDKTELPQCSLHVGGSIIPSRGFRVLAASSLFIEFGSSTDIQSLFKHAALQLHYILLNTLCFKKTGTLFISFIIHSNDDQFTRNFYQM